MIRFILALLASMRRRAMERETARLLARLSDRQLQDIGMNRYDIANLARG